MLQYFLSLLRRMPPGRSAGWLHRLFVASVALKGLDGVLETAGGVLVVLTSRADLRRWALSLTAPELSEDPTDWGANYLRHFAAGLSGGTWAFIGVYLLVNGAVKVLLALGLLRDKLWAYRAAFVFLALFIAYQFYRLGHSHSLPLLAFMLLDAGTLYLIWHEYRARGRRVGSRPREVRPGGR